ncbi:MAG: glucose-6-phosphate dehydrogenase assembly protein OpcA [Verrucomicrobiales bacterium]|nr:glucose-6-phosphate dehydrogenase assembly protein OpcA [Verrucomicrobiales bacterium]
MPPPQLTDIDLSRLGMEVPLPRIDHALKELWEQDRAKTRASLVNFAIYTEDPCSLARNMEMLESITAEHACRAILILNLPDGNANAPRAYINALCRPYQGQQVVCSEQLCFILEKGTALQVQNMVFAHLDADLPLVLWWQGSLTQHFDERLHSRVQTLIVDSSRWTDPAAELDALSEALESRTSHFDVRDLSWTRSHFLRLALAGCFQDAQALAQLPQIDRIEISHAKGQRSAGLLLGAWVAGRMQGELQSAGEEPVFARPDGPSITLHLQESPDGPALSSLTLSGMNVQIHVSRDGESRFVHVCAHCTSHEHEEVFPADVESDAELIGEQLSRAGGRTLYASMIPVLRRLV